MARVPRLLLPSILAGLFTAFPSFSAAQPAQPPLLLVGDRDYPPITFLEEGVARGVDVDIARAIAQRIGREIRIELMDWHEAQQRVLRGEADGLLSMSVTDERLRLFDFTRPTRSHVFGLFVRRDDVVTRGPGDLEARRVGVTPGGFPRRHLEQHGAANLVLIDNYASGFAQVEAGTIDAVAADTWVAAYTAQRHRYPDVRLAGGSFATRPAAIALRKPNGALAADIDAAIEDIKVDGTLDAILDRWRPEQMWFISRARLQLAVLLTTGIVAVALVGVSGVWARVVRRQARRRERVGAALAETRRRFALAAAERAQLEEQLRAERVAADRAPSVRDDVRVRERLREAQRVEATGHLAASLVHDFNNMLTVILATTEEVLSAPGLDAAVRDRLGEIRHASDSAAALSQQLLAFSRKRTPHTRLLDLNEVLGATTRMTTGLLRGNVEFHLRTAPDLAPVYGDARHLQQVIVNLVINARDAMPEGGRITIETRNVTIAPGDLTDHPSVPPGDYVLLAVSDSGAGMDPSTRERIFEPFFTTKAGSGFGLGLSAVHDIVTGLGGYIRVWSQTGVGSTFWIYLPKASE